MRQRCAASFIVSLGLCASPAAAQTATLEGGVSGDSLGRRSLPGAEVSIPSLHLTTRANFAGEYRLTGIAPGRYLVIAAASGVRSAGDSVTVGAGTTYHDFVLATKAIILDSVVSKAPAERKYISPGLNGLDERSKQGFGYFVTEDQLRKMDSETLSDVIMQHIPSVNFIVGPGGAKYLVSGRKPSAGPGLLSSSRARPCLTEVWVDGIMLYNYGMEDTGPNSSDKNPEYKRIDLSKMNVDQYAGVEFYAGASTYPAWIPRTNTDCGVLLLWTRER
jgi:hypothetical protein